MTINDFSNELKRMYFESPKGEAKTMIYLFGIQYAKEIEALGVAKEVIAKTAGVPKTYGGEINSGVKLAKYVQVIS